MGRGHAKSFNHKRLGLGRLSCALDFQTKPHKAFQLSAISSDANSRFDVHFNSSGSDAFIFCLQVVLCCLRWLGCSGSVGSVARQETVTRVARGILERLASGEEEEATWPFACA